MARVLKDWLHAGPSPLGNPLQCLETHEWSETYRDGVRPCITAAAAVAATAATIRQHDSTTKRHIDPAGGLDS